MFLSKKMVPMVLLGAVLVLAGVSGCASSSRKTTTVETTSTAPAVSAYDTEKHTTVETSTATTQTTTEPGRPTGIISGTVHVLGEIIAFPFRMIGKLFQVIF